MTWLSLLIPQHITFHHIMAFLGTIKFVIKRWNNDEFRWEVKGWTITEKRSFQYHDYNAHQKNPIIKLVSDRSTGREIYVSKTCMMNHNCGGAIGHCLSLFTSLYSTIYFGFHIAKIIGFQHVKFLTSCLFFFLLVGTICLSENI